MTRRSKAATAPHTDAELFTVARQALDQLPGPPTDVRVQVEHGYVTLSGSVRWAADAEEAERVVRRIPGVQGVINSLVVVHMPSSMGYKPPER